ncbi:hypothetical protein MWMV17_MWMV17_00705 [Acinetobacter calcoaceticus]|uniref:Phage antitermination protein Q n=1 Tax=Acinetobacter calcoaceticus DSM 30006 = CIP 81.8 TaxID=981331 RepID=A0ABP2UF24_ACICA|nr:hypothetical protein [Acinetobacter calcoaceticus]ENV99029.1 hypothetical protein F936_02112 [Acinetobacter calcoaceticus DSM 30006 = CIP 81.8]CAI3111872.1 hypothetical protein MWMV17_MWMV17_00705 [Acinetobacter calcoaceticus]SUU55568.1 Phage antitermination protein Q [Acinetobacter calcoaceticus]
MTLMIDKKHVMHSVDWSRFDLEGWLYQFGAWLDQKSFTGIPSGAYSNPIASAMVQVEKQRHLKRLGKKKQREIIANYFVSESDPFRKTKSKAQCQIDDNEARAVQRLILDLMGQSEVMDEWMDAIIDRYFRGQSWPEMANEDRTQNDARQDVKCGLAALHCRYGFIVYL